MKVTKSITYSILTIYAIQDGSNFKAVSDQSLCVYVSRHNFYVKSKVTYKVINFVVSSFLMFLEEIEKETLKIKALSVQLFLQ